MRKPCSAATYVIEHCLLAPLALYDDEQRARSSTVSRPCRQGQSPATSPKRATMTVAKSARSGLAHGAQCPRRASREGRVPVVVPRLAARAAAAPGTPTNACAGTGAGVSGRGVLGLPRSKGTHQACRETLAPPTTSPAVRPRRRWQKPGRSFSANIQFIVADSVQVHTTVLESAARPAARAGSGLPFWFCFQGTGFQN